MLWWVTLRGLGHWCRSPLQEPLQNLYRTSYGANWPSGGAGGLLGADCLNLEQDIAWKLAEALVRPPPQTRITAAKSS